MISTLPRERITNPSNVSLRDLTVFSNPSRADPEVQAWLDPIDHEYRRQLLHRESSRPRTSNPDMETDRVYIQTWRGIKRAIDPGLVLLAQGDDQVDDDADVEHEDRDSEGADPVSDFVDLEWDERAVATITR